jgi:hypothetical protein
MCSKLLTEQYPTAQVSSLTDKSGAAAEQEITQRYTSQAASEPAPR